MSNQTNTGDQLHKIREILFGEQMTLQRERTDERLEQMAARLSQDMATLRDSLNQQIEAVEDRLLRKIDEMSRQLETERDRREENIDQLSSRFEERTAQASQALRAEIETQTRSLQSDLQAHIEHRITELTTLLDQESNARKVSAGAERAHLCALFADLSKQLQPKPEDDNREESTS